MSEELDFHLEERAGITVVVWDHGGVSPAPTCTQALWAKLQAAEARAEKADGVIKAAIAWHDSPHHTDAIYKRQELFAAVQAYKETI